MSDNDIAELVNLQLESYGVSCVSVSDGHVFTFTLETLEALVEQAKDSGAAILFVKRGMAS